MHFARTRLFCTVSLLALLAAGCKKSLDVTTLPSVTGTVPANFASHQVSGVTLKAPPDWKPGPTNGNVVLMLFAPDQRTNINLVITDQQPGEDLQDAPKQVPEMFAKKVPSFKLIKADLVQVNRRAHARIEYEMAMAGVPLKGMQFICQQGSKDYILTYTAPAASFDANAMTAEQVALSMQLP